jgi:hypothetical protein
MEERYTLVGVDGNAFSVIGYVRRAMKERHKTKEEIDAYTKDAMSSNYVHLVNTSIDMIDKLNEELNEE